MAELIGVVGSAISVAQLASQVASGVIKLKSYLDQIKDAPEDYKILVEEIEDLQFLLADIENDQARQKTVLIGTSSALRSMDYCKRAVERLHRVMDGIGADFDDAKLSKSRWASAKMIWRREKIEKYRSNIAAAVRLLSLAHQIYTNSLIQIQPEIFIAQLESSHVVSIAPSLPSSASELEELASVNLTTQTEERLRSRRRLYRWERWKTYHSSLFGRAWNLQLYRSQQGWQFSMLTYAVVPYDSLIVQYAKAGNIKEMQRLFSSREASPFTICSRSPCSMKSLLDIGAWNANYEVCSLLINEGVDPNFTISPFPPIFDFAMNSLLSRPKPENHAKVAELLASQSETLPQILQLYRGPVESFSIIIKYLESPMSEMPLEWRCNLATASGSIPTANSPDVFLAALACSTKSVARIVYEAWNGRRQTLLHVVMDAVGRLIECAADPTASRVLPIGPKDYENYISGWKTIAHELLLGGADINAISEKYTESFSGRGIEEHLPQKPMTPLLAIFRSCHQSDWKHCQQWTMRRALSSWIEMLYQAGVDLLDYAVKEKAIWKDIDVARECICCFDEDCSGRGYFDNRPWFWKRLVSFSYGPSPKDWVFWDNEQSDEFAGDFWLMLEKKQEVMPGTWIE